MNQKQEEMLAAWAALLVLFTALLAPLVSFIIAAASIVGLVIYELRHRRVGLQ